MCALSRVVGRFHISMFFFFKQKTAYEMRISDWSSDVCSSDLGMYPQQTQNFAPHCCELRQIVCFLVTRQIEFLQYRGRPGAKYKDAVSQEKDRKSVV